MLFVPSEYTLNMIKTDSSISILDLRQQFETEGYAIARSLFSPEEVEEIRENFEELHAKAPILGYENYFNPARKPTNPESKHDPLLEYPRVIHPHRFNEVAKKYMLHPGAWECLRAFFAEEPTAVQSMYYYKPPGSRGQAFHQDNIYLMVSPGTCVAAWTAIDDADQENGGMYIVPKTHTMDVVCPEKSADPQVSFTKDFVPVPKGHKAVLHPLKAGDTLFFNGSLIHGSGPNRSKTRFRRSFICHYAAGSLEKISKGYLPLTRADGSTFEVQKNEGGGPCGTEWSGGYH
jgi:phytanoyl-CoA hydroxylase